MLNSVPVAINRGNLLNEILTLVQERYGVLHTKVNGMGVGVVDGKSTVSGKDWIGRDMTG